MSCPPPGRCRPVRARRRRSSRHAPRSSRASMLRDRSRTSSATWSAKPSPLAGQRSVTAGLCAITSISAHIARWTAARRPRRRRPRDGLLEQAALHDAVDDALHPGLSSARSTIRSSSGPASSRVAIWSAMPSASIRSASAPGRRGSRGPAPGRATPPTHLLGDALHDLVAHDRRDDVDELGRLSARSIARSHLRSSRAGRARTGRITISTEARASSRSIRSAAARARG